MKNCRELAKNIYASIGKWTFLPLTIFLIYFIKKPTLKTVNPNWHQSSHGYLWPLEALRGGEHIPGRSRLHLTPHLALLRDSHSVHKEIVNFDKGDVLFLIRFKLFSYVGDIYLLCPFFRTTNDKVKIFFCFFKFKVINS